MNKTLRSAHCYDATPDDVIDLTRFYRRDGSDLFAKTEALGEKVERVRERGFYLWRHRIRSASERACIIEAEGVSREVLLLSSNNYLGLTTHPHVKRATCEAIERHGTGSGSAPFFSGTYETHSALEASLAELKGTEDAALFSSGYAANVGVISALARESDCVYSDELVHASIIDGIRMSGAKRRVFHHNDLASLEQLLAADAGSRSGKLIVVDGVYSMDGDIADVPGLLQLARRYGARLLVDEAHATGVIGPRGFGISDHFGLAEDDLLVVGTLSKALGSVGGFFAGPRRVVDYVRHYGRPAMFSTALPPHVVAAALASVEVLRSEPDRVWRLQQNARHLRDRLRECSLRVGATESPIIPVIVGDQPKLLELGRRLFEAGVHANCVFYPAVAPEQCRLRLSVMATHTREDLELAVRTIVETFQSIGLEALDAMPASRAA